MTPHCLVLAFLDLLVVKKLVLEHHSETNCSTSNPHRIPYHCSMYPEGISIPTQASICLIHPNPSLAYLPNCSTELPPRLAPIVATSCWCLSQGNSPVPIPAISLQSYYQSDQNWEVFQCIGILYTPYCNNMPHLSSKVICFYLLLWLTLGP